MKMKKGKGPRKATALTVAAIAIGGLAIVSLLRHEEPATLAPEVEKEARKSSAVDRLKVSSQAKVTLPQTELADAGSQAIQASQKHPSGGEPSPVPTRVATEPPSDPFSAALQGKPPPEEKVADVPARPSVTLVSESVNDPKIERAAERSAKVFLAKTEKNRQERKETQASREEGDNHKWTLAELSKFASPTTITLVGRSQTTGEVGRIKRGTRVLCRLEDSLTVTSGEQYSTSCVVTGILNAQSFPEGVTILGKASLDKAENGVVIAMDACINNREDMAEVACQGEVKDLWGRRTLKGEKYSAAAWSIIARTAGTLVSTYILSQMTTSSTAAGVVMDKTASNQVRDALAAAANKAADEIAKSYDRTQTQVSLAGGAIVQVEFTETTDLW